MHQAASSVKLTCAVTGSFYFPLIYKWYSNCSGNCFSDGEDNSTIIASSVGSIDSGVHTCAVEDSVGNTGMATIELTVTGIR